MNIVKWPWVNIFDHFSAKLGHERESHWFQQALNQDHYIFTLPLHLKWDDNLHPAIKKKTTKSIGESTASVSYHWIACMRNYKISLVFWHKFLSLTVENIMSMNYLASSR